MGVPDFYRGLLVVVLGCLPVAAAPVPRSTFRAGAAAIDITPHRLPVEVNGMFLTRTMDRVAAPLHARAVVFERGSEKVALVVVDSCMVPRDVCDQIKGLAANATGIAVERMLVAATHTHSAPSVMDCCLGSMRDEAYTRQMIPQVADAIIRAHARLEPATAGAAAIDAWGLTHCRRWIKRSDRVGTDPFGMATVRAMMHPNPFEDYVGPAGPVDPAVTVLSVARPDGRPLAIVANFSMHYLGAKDISPDYFGPFSQAVEAALEKRHPGTGCVAMMTQGTSGDLHRKPYDPDGPAEPTGVYHERLAALALEARDKVVHAADPPLAMAQAELTLARRVPDAARLAWADRFNDGRGDRPPKDQPEVYAMQARWLHEHPSATLVLQAVRIGDFAIAALPNEVFGITGLKLKRHSPLPLTMNVELANGAEGYIPPPEQHVLGGYTTWPASTAGLEVEAEPKIVERLLRLLEQVADKPRRPWEPPLGPAVETILGSKPFAYWRLDEIRGRRAADAVGDHHGTYEDGVAFYLPGVGGDPTADFATGVPARPNGFSGPQINRAPHFAGGRVAARLSGLARDYSVSLWVWNGFPTDARAVTGHAFSRGAAGGQQGDHLGIGGTHHDLAGRLFVSNGVEQVSGRTVLPLRRWHHVVLVRAGGRVRLHLDSRPEPELDAALPWTLPDGVVDGFIGGRCDGSAGFEGRIDEVAVFDRPLAPDEIVRLHAASGRPPGKASAAKDQPAVSDQPPLPPEEAAARIAVPRGFRLQLAAAEPQVLDPVAFDWDAAGRLWVVEMADYPLGLDGKGKPGGRVRVLDDVDRDGRHESASLFAEGLNFPNGCLTWRDGVIVTAAPEILFLADTDGDGRADRREVLIHGLAEGNQQLRPNGLRWGLDNWVYVASGSPGGGQGSTLESRRGGVRLAVGTRDFRFRPDTGELEAEAGPTQFGRNRDDWGHWFGTQNAKPLWHYRIAERYAARNPFVAVGTLTQPVLPADVAVHPALPPEKRYHNFQQAGHYTSACGGMIHRDPALFGPDDLTAFVCEPFHNLVQRAQVREAGVSFAAAPVVENGRDFLTSTDRCFRPVMVRTGPDGCLWVADMQRFMIEHPDWLPPAGREELLPKYRVGDDRGRMYRISRSDAASAAVPDLRGLDGPALVQQLDSENGFLRDKVHQMLLWRGGDDALPALRASARDPGRPFASLHALCVLEGLGRLEADDLPPALAAASPGLRENALRLAEHFLRDAAAPSALREAVVACAASASPKVRFQAALTLGECPTAEAGAALARLMIAGADDPAMLAAVMTSAPAHAAALASAAVRTEPTVLDRVVVPLMQVALGRGDEAATTCLLAAVDGRPGDAATSARLAAVLGACAAAKRDLTTLAAGPGGEAVAREAMRMRKLIDATLAFAAGGEAAAADRLAAAEAAARSPEHRDRAIAVLAGWLTPAQPVDVQQRVVRACAAAGTEDARRALAAFWPESTPAVRQAVLDAWISRDAWCLDLLARVRAGEVTPASLDPATRGRLLSHGNRQVSGLARDLLGTASRSRAEVVERYRPALSLSGDPSRGVAVYRRACAGCHRHGDEGRAVGPDARTFAAHAAEKLLANILDPNADVQPGYHAFVCAVDSGEQIYGIITGETAASIDIKAADGVETSIPRARIEGLRATNVSLMPEGLEQSLTVQDVADVIAFLRRPVPAGGP